jgi:glycosyltransferase involved in cell wall biosynthesis
MNLSLVIPVKDEELILENHVKLITDYLDQHSISAEILLIENGSADNTWPIIEKLSAGNKNIIGLRLPEAFFGEAIKVGCLKAKYDIVIMSIDLTMGLDFISTSLELLKKYDIVNGSRFCENAFTNRKTFRRIASSVYHPLARLFYNVSLTDFDGNKALRNDAAKKLVARTRSKHNFFFTELLVIANNSKLSIIEVPLNHIENRKSRFSIRKLIFFQLTDLFRSLFYLKKTKI